MGLFPKLDIPLNNFVKILNLISIARKNGLIKWIRHIYIYHCDTTSAVTCIGFWKIDANYINYNI